MISASRKTSFSRFKNGSTDPCIVSHKKTKFRQKVESGNNENLNAAFILSASQETSNCQNQGCQMVCFQTKNPKFGYFLEGLLIGNVGILYDHLKYFIWYNLWPFGIGSLRSFCYVFPVLVCLDQEKSGNPGQNSTRSYLFPQNKQFAANLKLWLYDKKPML
jgi:hypothetical protein